MRIYVETYGCQMNEYDSKMIRSMLAASGHQFVDGPGEADVVIVNTCAVRERAERRVLGRLSHLRGLMPRGAALGVIGCVAQRLGDDLTRGGARVDFVVGTDRYDRLPAVVASAAEGVRIVDTAANPEERYEERPAPEGAGLSEFVSVMRGCDNFCSYCVVPHVRGRERSRAAASVLAEIEALVARGTREVTLIGQNVNSYRDGALGFADLLERAGGVPGLLRVRFATSHPKDLSPRLIEAVARGEGICEHVHLPVQSGADRILRAMNRSYSRDQYVDLVASIRDAIPDVALTTDVIVGFPGETEEDYRETLSLLREIRFDSAFMFRYSVREGTAAAALPDDVPEDVKIARLEGVIALEKAIAEERNTALEGTTVEVLVEGPSERDESVLFGRTRTGKAAVFAGAPDLAGTLARVVVRSSTAWTLRGDLVG
jgi:tRNA-2-methylthio-N6-dimethylallyladenosine synthase